MATHRPGVLLKDVAFHVPGDPPGENNERYISGTPVRIPLRWRECCDGGERQAFRFRVEIKKTHHVVEVGGVYRLLEQEYFE